MTRKTNADYAVRLAVAYSAYNDAMSHAVNGEDWTKTMTHNQLNSVVVWARVFIEAREALEIPKGKLAPKIDTYLAMANKGELYI